MRANDTAASDGGGYNAGAPRPVTVPMNLDRVPAGRRCPQRLQRHHRDPDARRSDQVRSRQGRPGPCSSIASCRRRCTIPCNYGYIPRTLSDDGDPSDVLVLSPMPLITGVVVRCRPIGMLKMDDEAGGDAKILAVPIDKLTGLYRAIQSPRDLPESRRARSRTFSSTTRISSPASGCACRLGSARRKPRPRSWPASLASDRSSAHPSASSDAH